MGVGGPGMKTMSTAASSTVSTTPDVPYHGHGVVGLPIPTQEDLDTLDTVSPLPEFHHHQQQSSPTIVMGLQVTLRIEPRGKVNDKGEPLIMNESRIYKGAPISVDGIALNIDNFSYEQN